MAVNSSSSGLRREDPVASPGQGWLRPMLAVAGVAVASYFLGGLTSPAQEYLPDEISPFANSSSGWTMLTFLLIWQSRLPPLWAAVSGAIAFVLMVDGYRIVSEWRGYGYGAPFQDIFTFIGIVVGPVIGVSAALLRYGSPTWKTISIVPLTSVLIGEGVYGLTVVGDTTSPVYWSLIIVSGLAITVIHLVVQRPGSRLILITCALTVVGAAVFFMGYQLPILFADSPGSAPPTGMLKSDP